MGNVNPICTSEIEELNTKNVMNCQMSAKFVRARSLLQRCYEAQNMNANNPFSEFCLYPPNENRMSVMCKPKHQYTGEALFWKMLENEITDVRQLPRVITYKHYSSHRDWVLAPLTTTDCGVKNLALAQEIAITSDVKNGLLTIIDNAVYMLNDVSGVIEKVKEITETVFQPCSAVACNTSGNVRAVIVQQTNAYIWTRASNLFVKLLFRQPVDHFVALLMWEDSVGLNAQTFFLIAYSTSTEFRLCFYKTSSKGDLLDIASLIPYKDIKVPRTNLSAFAWCLRHPNMTDIFFAISRSTANNVYFYETFFVGIDATSGALPKHTLFVDDRVVGYPGPLQQNYDGLFSANAEQLSIVVNKTLMFQVPVQTTGLIIYLATQPNFRMCSTGNVSCTFYQNLFVINGIQQPRATFNIAQTDVFAITPDEKYIFVVTSSDGGLGHRYEIATQTWNDDTDDRFKLSYIPPTGAELKLDETMNGATEWFLGISFNENDVVLDKVSSLPHDFFLSRHSTFKISAQSKHPESGVARIDVLEVNVGHMLRDVNRVVHLYDNGVICVFLNQTDANANNIYWNSFTDDKEGSNRVFTVLPSALDENAAKANGAHRAVSSMNGRYLLLVFANDRVDLVLNPFNAPRFTQFTNQVKNLQYAVNAQSTFCFRALNDGKTTSFVDKRCSCLPSMRLLQRVYADPQKLAPLVQERLFNDLPCVSADCQLTDAEFTNAKAHVGVKCIVPTGVCAQTGDRNFDDNLVSTQNCGVSLMPCVSSKECPLGTSCHNGQCVAQCSSDETCKSANLFARCINGDCRVLNAEQIGSRAGTRLSNLWIIAITIASIVLMLLILLVYFTVVRINKKARF